MAYKPCKWLDTRGAKRLTIDTACVCRWPMPELQLPVSITESPLYRSEVARKSVRKDDCSRCPCYEPEGE